MKRDRADKLLVQLGLAKSRSKAMELIERGVVFYEGKKVTRAKQQISGHALEVKDLTNFVSRGARKLEHALENISLNFKNKIVVDVGASTGGFTQVALNHGAQKVYCLDVGKNQLDEDLKKDPRIINLEGLNIKNGVDLGEKADIALVDLSFISLKLVIKSVFDLVQDSGKVLALIKPQFEVGKGNLGKGGIVRERKLHIDVLLELYQFFIALEFYPKDFCLSAIKGRGGNQEFFILLERKKESIPFTQIEALI
jgi:23S rRNA (cytidine1920-2'-O)/16S rRNA (cytidine1409-2'-O)-methyltransferase